MAGSNETAERRTKTKSQTRVEIVAVNVIESHACLKKMSKASESTSDE